MMEGKWQSQERMLPKAKQRTGDVHPPSGHTA